MSRSKDGGGKVSRLYFQFTDHDHEIICDTFQRRRCGIRRYQTLKGFLSAIAVNPDPPPERVWLQRIWNHRKATSLRDQRLIATMRDPILRLYQTILMSLDPADTWYDELVNWEDGYEELELNASKWCLGFRYGMELSPERWCRLGEEALGLLKPMSLFGTWQGLDLWYTMEKQTPQLAERWLERIAPAVVHIRDYWIRRAAGESFH
jgi:yecA family protein